jgi:polysaccharide export outer membrane protein
MQELGRRVPRGWFFGAMLLTGLLSGCVSAPHREPLPVPHELARVSLPPHVIEPPDILLIDVVRLVPRPPYRIEPLDAIAISVTEALPEKPIAGIFTVETDGRVALGFNYGAVFVQGMSLAEARVAIERHLRRSLKPPYDVKVEIAESRAHQQVRGPHLVQPDGTVTLGVYGQVYVDNLTLPMAREAIENHLSQFFVNPEVSLSIQGFNSKVFYVITDGSGVAGDQIIRLPMTGKTTVLDALGFVNGLPVYSWKHRMWVVRPAPAGSGGELILPVDYNAIVRCGKTATNYQLFPGDRLYVKAAPLMVLDAYVSRLLAPLERVMGTTLLGAGVITSIQQINNQGALGGVGGVNP